MIADFLAQILSRSGHCLAFRIVHESLPAGLEELLGPFAIQALRDPLRFDTTRRLSIHRVDLPERGGNFPPHYTSCLIDLSDVGCSRDTLVGPGLPSHDR